MAIDKYHNKVYDDIKGSRQPVHTFSGRFKYFEANQKTKFMEN